jgi:hypothetical protein
LKLSCAYVLGNQIDPIGKPECKENQSKTMIIKPRLWGDSKESGCAYVPGIHNDPLGKPECKENQSETMIMKPRLWGESLEPGCAYVPGTQIDLLGTPECKENQSKTMIMKPRLWGERFGIRLRLCTWQSDRPPWQARMQGKPIENNDYGAQAAGGKVWNQAAPMYLAIRSTPLASRNARKTNQKQ